MEVITDKLLILDLDETLIFSSSMKLSRTEDFLLDKYFVYKRPGIKRFLSYAQDNFQLAVWTASSSDYAQSIVDKIFINPGNLKFVWARERCATKINFETHERYWIKDLKKVKKLGFDLDKVLVVDDIPQNLQRSYGNYIPISPFEGDINDNELFKLKIYLDTLKDLDSVRAIDKRNWQNSVE